MTINKANFSKYSTEKARTGGQSDSTGRVESSESDSMDSMGQTVEFRE